MSLNLGLSFSPVIYKVMKHLKSTLFIILVIIAQIVWAQDHESSKTSSEGSALISTVSNSKKNKEPTGPPEDISQIPLPKARGFWGTFFFWSGGVLSMYLVGRKVFKEQAHERKTLKRFRDELGHFFPEFDPINIKKWVEIAAPHLYHGWREGDFASMESFTSDKFLDTQKSQFESKTETDQKRTVHLDKVIAVHTLGATWEADEKEGVTHPPLGVQLTLRVETKAIDFVEDLQGQVILGKKKPDQFQQIWHLTHNGKTWTLNEVYETASDITHLADLPPLPEIVEWRRPETILPVQESTDKNTST